MEPRGFKISKVGILFGLLLSLPLMGLATLEAVVAWKVMEHENLAFIQQSIGDSTQAFASYFRLGLGTANHPKELSSVKMAELKSIFKNHSIVSIMLIDTQTQTIVPFDRPDVEAGETSDQILKAFIQVFNTTPDMPNGQLELTAAGQTYLGGYSRLNVGHLAVIATVPKHEATASLNVMFKQLLIYLGVCFLLLTTGGYMLATRSEISDFLAREGVVKGLANLTEMTRTGIVVEMKPKIITAFVLHGSLLQEQMWLHSLVEDSSEAMNEFFNLVSGAIHSFGGTFKIESGTSFVGVWGISGSDLSHFPYLLAGLQIRAELKKLNAARLIDGKRPLYCSMGVHTGMALVGRFGGSGSKDLSVLGDVLTTAKMLDRLTLQCKVDLLISSEVFQPLQTILLGDRKGEFQFSSKSLLTPYYSLSGYRDGEREVRFVEPSFPEGESVSREVRVDGVSVNVTVAATDAAPLIFKRWLINNGSQMLGPLTPREIAGRLFAQELDFDCECWAEGTGNSAEIKNAGIFSGSEDADAKLWAFDGELIHGPLSVGFLKTALKHGALPKTISLCEGTTVHGWKTLAEFTKARSDLDLGVHAQEHPVDPKKKAA